MSDPDDEDEDEEIWQYSPPPGDYEASWAAFEVQQAANEERRRERDAFMVEYGEEPGGNDVAYRRALGKFFKDIDWSATFAEWGWRQDPNSQSPDPEEGSGEVIDPEARSGDQPQP